MSIEAPIKTTSEGLLLHFDAANNKSYRGSGTSWRDLSGNGNNGTLTATAATFSSDKNGAIIFAGGYCTSTISLPSSAMTIEIVFKINGGAPWTNIAVLDDGTNEIMLEYGGFNAVPNTNGHLRYYSNYANGVGSVSDSLASLSQFIANPTINCAALTVGSSIATSYFNGVYQGSASVTENKTFNRLVVANDLVRGNRQCACNVYSVKLYNRALSPIEILQNYDSTKSRFGL